MPALLNMQSCKLCSIPAILIERSASPSYYQNWLNSYLIRITTLLMYLHNWLLTGKVTIT